MTLLTGYIDETGHSKDERQRFVGVAGLVAQAEHWEVFERKWKETLNVFKLPYFHMKDFACRRKYYEGWSEPKRQKLFGKLMRIIATTHPFPVGAIVSLDDYRSFPAEDREMMEDPYHFCLMGCVYLPAWRTENASPDVRLSIVFSEQSEFKNMAGLLLDDFKQNHTEGQRFDTPVFEDMKMVVPLQAADIVAYELYKEFERRRYRSEAEQRYGYKELIKVARRSYTPIPFIFHTRDTLAGFVRNLKS
jgi:hypothetical protein